MEKLIFFGLVIPILFFVLYLGTRAIMSGVSAKQAIQANKEENEIDDNIEIEINTQDLKIDTYRASGAGGQHVNRTDSAVRITHLPTNIVVQCQSDRSQHKNRSNAMKMIKSRIYETELQKRKEDEDIKNKEKKEIGWGNQIRSYVLHPYKLIKDLRSGYETSNVNDVLDGKIDNFLENSLTL